MNAVESLTTAVAAHTDVHVASTCHHAILSVFHLCQILHLFSLVKQCLKVFSKILSKLLVELGATDDVFLLTL